MKDKNLPPDNSTQSLEELTKVANNIIESLEREKNLQNSIDSYQELLKLNNIIEKKFHKNIREINEATKKKITNITSKKNEKQTY
jgi:predicted RNA-binding protein with EMAP domain